ncbi:MAG: 2-succinyl-6-hydroxy-2,4-cyclohexadiene-1-carboxylate synthase [Deltaproteobacteria bacterium]|nr:2-succinyl-6-hydroxy-2,4-cyclohexadiene-1-carboxylate synthase [Deltaproteobacteria bacterium]
MAMALYSRWLTENSLTRPVVVCLHGFAGDSSTWEELAPGMSRWGDVLAVDLPGHGGSPPPDTGNRMGHCVTGLEAVLVSQGIHPRQNPRPLWWVGYSMGGRAALNLACRKPHLAARLVLVSATAGLETADEREARLREDEALAQAILEGGMESFVADWLARPLFAGLRQLPPLVFRRERAMRLAQNPQGLAACLEAMGTGAMAPVWGSLPQLAMPVLLAAGREDPKFAGLAQKMAGLIPHSRLALIPGAGHAPHTEQPQRFIQAVGDFFSAN